MRNEGRGEEERKSGDSSFEMEKLAAGDTCGEQQRCDHDADEGKLQ